jgi:hypothetical protein
MAEEETGFTFVDKRRAQTEEAPEAEAALEAGDGLESDSMEDEGLDAGAAPSVYELLGYCINLLASQAWQKLGLLADPQTGEAKPDLSEAKVAIDTVADLTARLESAPETVIPAAMRRELRTLLNDLRLNYVSRRGQDVVPEA